MPNKRPPIQAVAGQMMGAVNSRVPGLLTFLQPNPVLQISTGATANLQGQFAYALSGIDPEPSLFGRRAIDGEDA